MSSNKHPRPDRVGKRLLGAHIDTAVHTEFKTAAFRQGRKVTELMLDGIALALIVRGEPLPSLLCAHITENPSLAAKIQKLVA